MNYKVTLKAWEARRKRLFTMLRNGLSKAEIARKEGITRQRVGQIISHCENGKAR